MSEARVWVESPEGDGGTGIQEALRKTAPYLHLRMQLWLRELGRMVGEVSQTPGLTFADDLNDDQLKRHLPVVNCREYGSTARAGLKQRQDSFTSGNLEDFYPAFFGDDPKVTFLFPEESGAQNRPMELGISLFCTHCLNLTERLDRER